ncbi:type I-C CRISPR-associated protein Cas8c/Csd1 [bacterium]|nr:type I-C CRISPR-associated protein Cas8c/Csd1 [bacterium]
MILQSLERYYERISGVGQEGFQQQGIPFIIVLNKEGDFAGLLDTREGEGKKKMARSFLVPKVVKKSVNIAANLLWGTPAYVLGRPRPDKKKDAEKLLERAKKQQANFLDKINTFCCGSSDEGIKTVVRFLEKRDYEQLFNHSSWHEIEESGANITFQIEGDTELVCQREAVRNAITTTSETDSSDTQICLITGRPDTTARLHTAIKGVWGAQSSGANIVSFNLNAFKSFSKEQGYNAPVGMKSEFAYTTALNTLLTKGSRQRIQVGDASTVFWAEKKHEIEDWFINIFGEPAKGESDQDNAAIKALFKAPEIGAKPVLDDNTRFYVLGLAPNASRIAIRFWYNGTVAEVATNILRHFEDISIVHTDDEMSNCPLNELLASTAVETKDPKKTNRVYFRGKYYDVIPNLAGDFMKAILTGTPYPRTLLGAVITRAKAEQSKKDSKTGKSIQNVSYSRAAIIKAILNRDARYRNSNIKEVISMSLDTSNINPGYLLGRLFAVLEKVQIESAGGEGKINATIRDRFYSSASSTPVIAFPHLMKLKNHHIAKLDNRGRAINLDKLIGEIVDGIQAETCFPDHLSLDNQGRFAVGYYHQRQDFFKKKEKEGETKNE